MHLCLGQRNSRRPALLVVTDVLDENIAAILRVTHSKPSFVRSSSSLPVNGQTGILGESGAAMITNVPQFLWENWMDTFAAIISTGNSSIY
jgi:hypothetical protein